MINVAPLVEARTLLNKAVDQILVQLKDTSLPLDERWDAYTQLVKSKILIRDEMYGNGFIDTLSPSLTMCDDFHTDRRETTTFVDMYDTIMEADFDYGFDLATARDKNLAAWQEKVLASGYSSFTYDW